MKLIIVIDVHHVAYRCKYTMGDLSTRDGRGSGVVFGVLNSLRKLTDQFNPVGVVAAFDGGIEEKLKIDPQYKHARKVKREAEPARMLEELGEVPPSFVNFYEQVADIRKVMAALGCRVIWEKGYEADTVIGAVAAWKEWKGTTRLIVSGDRDFLQLAADDVWIYDDLHQRVWKPKGVCQEYQLVHPRELSTYKALVGDTSDGVKGVSGIGPKKAPAILQILRSSGEKPPYCGGLMKRETFRDMFCQQLTEQKAPMRAEQLEEFVRAFQLVDIPSAGRRLRKHVPSWLERDRRDEQRAKRLLLRYELHTLISWAEDVLGTGSLWRYKG